MLRPICGEGGMNPSSAPGQQPISDGVWLELAAAHRQGDAKAGAMANRLASCLVVAGVGSCGLLILLSLGLADAGWRLFALGAAALAGLVGLALAVWRTGHKRRPPPTPVLKDVPLCIIYDPPAEDDFTPTGPLEERLLYLCRQDRKLFGRLIEHERDRRPHLSRAEHVRLAIEHLKADNR